MSDEPVSPAATAERILQMVRESPREIRPDPPRSVAPTREETWEQMIVWPRFASARLEDVPSHLVPPLRVWLDGAESVLMVYGEVGTGKTHLAVAVAREAYVHRRRRVAMWSVVDLLDGLRPDGGADLDSLAGVDLLVLDDLGVERPTEWSLERLYALVNRRWLYERPTIITTNRSEPELSQGLGARVVSRLFHGSLAVELSGDDRRSGIRGSRP